jgi:hypothetical protein
MTESKVEDVILYRIPTEWNAKYAGTTAQEARQREVTAAFAAMATAANEYWAKGLPLRNLTPWEAARLGLLFLPASGARPNRDAPQWWQNMWMGELGDSTVAIGIVAAYSDLNSVIVRYGPTAKQIFFPYPQKVQTPIPPDHDGQLVMTFDRRGLARAALQAATPVAHLGSSSRINGSAATRP